MRISLTLLLLCVLTGLSAQDLQNRYAEMVDYIVQSLKPEQTENTVIRYDKGLMPGLAQQLAQGLEPSVGRLDLLPYGPVTDFSRLLSDTDIYIWMPVRRTVPVQVDQVKALVNWLDEGRGRQIHFHWGDGTRNWDSTHGLHNVVYDSIYLKALDIDYKELKRKQQAASRILRSGEINVTSPEGTDLRFRIGDRTITLQDGDASSMRMESAKVRIEREIELPAGAIRVAPLEETVFGTLVIGTGTIAGVAVEDLVLTFEEGRITDIKAAKGESQFRKRVEATTGLQYFRELGIGFNPNLNQPSRYDHVPYYGYGQGVVRLSLGNNIEVGGQVDADGVQWMFFLNTTVRVGNQYIVRDGRLQDL